MKYVKRNMYVLQKKMKKNMTLTSVMSYKLLILTLFLLIFAKIWKPYVANI